MIDPKPCEFTYAGETCSADSVRTVIHGADENSPQETHVCRVHLRWALRRAYPAIADVIELD